MTRGRLRGPLARAVVIAFVLLATTLGSTACSGSSPARPPTTAEIGTVLAAHGAAVLHHDRVAFLTGISDDAASAAYRARQSTVYANLVRLPLASWRYSFDDRTDDSGAERTATKRYGSPAWIVHVVLKYALRDVDTTPTMHDLYLTFVRVGGRVVLAGDTDLAADGGASWQGPWDFGSLVVAHGSRTIVLGHAAQAAELPRIAAAVDAAIPRVTAVWGTAWPQHVAVVVPSSSAELTADAGPTAQVTSGVPAETVSDGSDALSRAAYGLRLIDNPPALDKLSALGRQIVLRHEITHIATGASTSDSSPRWLVEGFADYVGQLGIAQSVPTIAAELAKVVRAGAIPTSLPTEATFDAQATAAQAYEEGWLACRLIAREAGQSGLVRFYRAVGASYDVENAVGDALRSIVHQSLAQFTATWRAYVRTELG